MHVYDIGLNIPNNICKKSVTNVMLFVEMYVLFERFLLFGCCCRRWFLIQMPLLHDIFRLVVDNLEYLWSTHVHQMVFWKFYNCFDSFVCDGGKAVYMRIQGWCLVPLPNTHHSFQTRFLSIYFFFISLAKAILFGCIRFKNYFHQLTNAMKIMMFLNENDRWSERKYTPLLLRWERERTKQT